MCFLSSLFLPSFFLFLTAVIMFVIAHVTDRFPRLPATMTFSDAATSPAVVACARETLWHSHMCDVMHWFVMAFFIHSCCFNWLIHECATTHTRVRHDSFVTWLICDMTHLWHDSFVTWLICLRDVAAHTFVSLGPYICVAWLIHVFGATPLYVWQDSLICLTRPILMHLDLSVNSTKAINSQALCVYMTRIQMSRTLSSEI